MLHISDCTLFQFKNYTDSSFQFRAGANAFTGLNGVGKTNLLDAIFYLCYTKSYFHKTDQQSIQYLKDGFRLEGIFNRNERLINISARVKKNEFKKISIDQVVLEKLSSHIGNFPCVMVTPSDIELIMGGSENRRRWVDMLLSQISADYLSNLILYNRALSQRNALLKDMYRYRTIVNQDTLSILTDQMVQLGMPIFEARRRFFNEAIFMIENHYHVLSRGNDAISVSYQSQLLEHPFKDALKMALDKDILLQRSTVGIHRDDVDLYINGLAFRTNASEGQKKSLLFALKLAEFEMLQSLKQFSPILLLDDVFEKLDEQRTFRLFETILKFSDVQLFITDTHQQRVKELFENLCTPVYITALSESTV